jgi:hypothetical protein
MNGLIDYSYYCLILLIAIYIDPPNSPGIHIAGIERDFSTHLGLDPVGGYRLFEANVPATTTINPVTCRSHSKSSAAA